MARIPAPIVGVIAVFLFSFTLSDARIPANIPGNEVTTGELASSLPESDANPVIRLPSDFQSHSNEPVKEVKESETVNTVQSVPLHVVTFRPVDHPFRLRSRFPYRCRHHHHHHRFFMPMRQHREIPYGNDMILARGENADFQKGMFNGGDRRIPAKWVKIHHHHHDDDEDESGEDGISKFMFRHSTDAFDKEKFKMHKHHHHHHHEDDEEEKEERFIERKEKAGGFFKRIRKILDHF